MKILVANRGEIAVRVLRACREMRIPSVAVYSECDRTAPHVRHADEAVAIGPSPAAESYLDIGRVLAAAAGTGATAVHPGYGFLAENPAFARACRSAGLTFIGPDAGVIETMGGKTAARRAAVAAGVPVVPGTEALPDTLSEAELRARADEVGYPLFIKAVAGGGGRGMRRVAGPDGVAAGVESARSEAGAAFGESTVYFERLNRTRASHRGPGARRRATARWCRSSSASARSSGGTRRSSKSRRRSRSPGRSGRRWPTPRRPCARPSATSTPAPSSFSSTGTAGSTSLR